jgi:hypothetical protein
VSTGWRIALYVVLFISLLAILDPRTGTHRQGARFVESDAPAGLQFLAGVAVAVAVTSVTVLCVEWFLRRRR